MVKSFISSSSQSFKRIENCTCSVRTERLNLTCSAGGVGSRKADFVTNIASTLGLNLFTIRAVSYCGETAGALETKFISLSEQVFENKMARLVVILFEFEEIMEYLSLSTFQCGFPSYSAVVRLATLSLFSGLSSIALGICVSSPEIWGPVNNPITVTDQVLFTVSGLHGPYRAVR